MISHITIRDFAIIENVSLDFHEGFHILTGETGAGKSILIEAISLALGSRADTAYVRTGADKAVIELIVETKDPEVLNLLSSNGIDDGETIYITREIHAAGKSVCRINGSLVSVSFLNELCKNIADIHGQYDHQSLLNPAYHIELIDRYDSKTIDPIKEKVKNAYELYIQTKQKLDSIVKKHAEYQRKLDFMKYELDEIVAADPKIGEDEKLAEKMQLLQNSEMIFEKLATAYEILYEQTPSCQDSLGKASNLLQEIQSFSGDINSIAEAISDCYYKLEDLKKYLRLQRDSISFSPDLLDETIERIDLLDRLKRKYGGSIEKVLNYKQELVENLKDIENSDELIEKLNKALVEYKNQLMEASQELTSKRKQVASEIETKINKELNELNFQNANLTVAFSVAGDENNPKFGENGVDEIEFLITTNKGEVPKPLAKIASGGEISRIMLAFKRIVGDYTRIPTMIFDEIDSGISGVTASIVGKKLKQLSKNHQIICITHLAQIAAYSDHHYRIYKDDKDGRTLTNVLPLSDEEKKYEIARLLGGMDISDAALKNAEDLIKQSLK